MANWVLSSSGKMGSKKEQPSELEKDWDNGGRGGEKCTTTINANDDARLATPAEKLMVKKRFRQQQQQPKKARN